MTRATRVASVFLVAALAWAALFFGAADKVLSPAFKAIIPALPVYALIVFGCYAMATIGSALLSYNDCTAAAAELKGDITRVKAALEKKGYKAPPMPAAKQ